jgi:hypothetical protein
MEKSGLGASPLPGNPQCLDLAAVEPAVGSRDFFLDRQNWP